MKYEIIRKPMVLERVEVNSFINKVCHLLICTLLLEAEFVDDPLLIYLDMFNS